MNTSDVPKSIDCETGKHLVFLAKQHTCDCKWMKHVKLFYGRSGNAVWSSQIGMAMCVYLLMTNLKKSPEWSFHRIWRKLNK